MWATGVSEGLCISSWRGHRCWECVLASLTACAPGVLAVWAERGGLGKPRSSNWGHTGGVDTPGLVMLASGSGGVWGAYSICIFPKLSVPGGVCV